MNNKEIQQALRILKIAETKKPAPTAAPKIYYYLITPKDRDFIISLLESAQPAEEAQPETRNEKIRQAIEKAKEYMHHDHQCDIISGDPLRGKCTCGYEQALSLLESVDKSATADKQEQAGPSEFSELEKFAKERLMPPTGIAKTYWVGRSDVGEGKKALEGIIKLQAALARKDEEIENIELNIIETHIEMLLEPEELERIGASKQAPSHIRELHHRIMRILTEYNKLQQQISEIQAELKAAKEEVNGRKHIDIQQQKQIQQLQAEVENAQKRAEKSRNLTCNIHVKLEQANKQITELEKELDKYKKQSGSSTDGQTEEKDKD